MSVFKYDKDSDGIVTITMDMTGPVNSMTAEYREAMHDTVARLEAEEGLAGVVFTSAKSSFFAGANPKELLEFEKGMEARLMAILASTKQDLRRLEKLPVPIVAAINGAALGGGLEICLACNYRIAVNEKSVRVGFPEVALGLLPGGGGVVRTVSLLGIEKALPYLLEDKRLAPEAAQAAGLVDATVDTQDELVPAAKAYILDNRNNEDAATQPWDRRGFRIPGGTVNSPKLAQLAAMAPPMLRQKTQGLLPAPEKILDVAYQATLLDFDAALDIESRAFIYLVGTPVAKNMITTFFIQLNEVNGGASRPKGIEKQPVNKLGILGAGMMGQGIAYVSAMAGIDVVLKDVSLEAAEKGKAYSEKLLEKRIARGRMDEAKKQAVLGRILATAKDADLSGCDLIVEAVFENLELKNKITASTEKFLADNGVWGSNTSTLPITELAKASSKPEKFIGIHFFSPVDKMPLVELICGQETSDETLARAFDFAQQIRKTPIVVNDSLGFFTSRTFGTYLDEGIRLLHEGVNPVRIDNLGKAVGMPVGPLAVHDETSLELTRKIAETWDGMGAVDAWGERDAQREVIATMIGAHGRGGRYHGSGFYEYSDDGSKRIWPKLFDLYSRPDYEISDDDIKDRILFRQVVETLKCLETNVLRSVADGNIGSIMGIGAPVWTGGFIQFVNTYGLERFIERCTELAAQYGERFEAPAIVQSKIDAGEMFA